MDTTKKVLLGVSVGVCLAASATAVYLLTKEEKLDTENLYNNRNYERYSVVRVKVPSRLCGPLIGRGGENIKRIEVETYTRINIEQKKYSRLNKNGNNVDETDGFHIDAKNNDDDVRYLVIRGLPENIVEAETRINEFVRNQPSITTENIYVPTSAIAYIIGKQGNTIRSISDSSCCKITIEKLDNNFSSITDRHKLSISGTSYNISMAKSLINEKLRETEQKLKYKLNFYNKTSICYDEKLQIENTKDGSLKESTLIYPVEKLVSQTGDEFVTVYVSCVKNPSEFWVQVTGNSTILDKLSNEITSFYDKEENRNLNKLENIKLGDMVVSYNYLDDNWYRSKVVEVNNLDALDEESSVVVFNVDYGNIMKVKKKCLCQIEDEFLEKIPFQAIKCKLNNVEPYNNDANGEWSEESIKYFCEITHASNWKEIKAKLVNVINDPETKENTLLVELSDLIQLTDVDIATLLVSKKYAIFSNN